MIKILETLAFFVSAAAFGVGVLTLLKKDAPRFFKLYVCAAGCYILEELWVIVNALLGSGAQDGLVTVRLFGFFGCLCFMLSANANEFDRIVDEGKNKKEALMALAAPVVLIALYAAYVVFQANTHTLSTSIIGFLSIAPALPAAYYSLKHLLLPEDAMGFLRCTRGIDIVSLAFYAANYLYPLLNLFCPELVMSVYDVVIALLLSVIVLMCGKGAKKWKTLI